nr:hypothetical protein [Tanacetum cinerariifolium]
MLDRSDFASWKQRAEGVVRPERDRVVANLTPDEKERYKADIRATNILLQGLPEDIYTLINHYTNAKDIWNNNKVETIHEYYVRFTKLINDMRNIKMTMPKMQLNSKFMKNILPKYGRFVTAVKLTEDRRNLTMISCGQTNTFDNDVDEAQVQDLTLNEDNVFQANQCDTFDSDVDEAPIAQTMFMANLSSVDPIYDEVGPSYDSDIISKVQEHDTKYLSDSNMIPYDQYVKDNIKPVVQRRYPQWRSRFLRYIDSRPNGEALRKCILSGPYKLTTILVQVIEATKDSSAIPEHTTIETPMNITPKNKAHFEAEKEAIHLILTGIGDEIYSTVDACQAT